MEKASSQQADESGDGPEPDMPSRFLTNLAHEMRTSIGLIQEPIQDMLDGKLGSLSPEMRTQHERMLRSAHRLLRLAEQARDLSKLKTGHLTLEEARRQDVSCLVKATTQAFRSLAERAGIDLTCTTPSGPVLLFIEHAHIEKVLSNLLSNAIKFTPRGGRVRVAVDAGVGYAQIRVEDTGVGISPEDRERIFERYRQAEVSSIQISSGGMGIGLALTRELTALHGGTVNVESTLGEGSTFIVRIPTGRDHLSNEQIAPDASLQSSEEPEHRMLPAPEQKAPDDEKNTSADKMQVLVVDDQPSLRMLVRRVFEPSYRVLEATDGADGLDRARNELPDCIVADVAMPRMDGFQMSRALKEDAATADIPILFLSARTGLQDKMEGLLTGANDYMTKPFKSELLWTRVGNLVAQRYRLRRRLQERTSSEVDKDDPHPDWIQHLRNIIFDHLTEDDFGPKDLAEASIFSYSSMYRRLREERDLTPSQFIRALRLERAAHLLERQAGSVSEVAYAVGFKSLSHFSRCFKDHYGQSPSVYA